MEGLKNVKIKALKTAGLLDEGRFFQSWSEQCNYADPKILREYWQGLVRATTKELRAHGCVRFPHLGLFMLKREKPRGVWQTHPPGRKWRMVLRFYFVDKWRRYFDNILRADPDAILDPRDKLFRDVKK